MIGSISVPYNEKAHLQYASQAVDGHTASTNNQPSWVGEGWDLNTGYVERQYRSCSDDGISGSGDQCWYSDNATLLLNGKSSTLIKDSATGNWRPSSDDIEKVEKMSGTTNGAQGGEYWRITTINGVQYYFGVNRIPGWASGNPETNSTFTTQVVGNNDGEPCHAATTDASRCTQAWRWNLDYVVDPHSNSMVYYYNQETNNYGAGLSYVRGGSLAKITYGSVAGQEFSSSALAQVVFATADRCVSGSSCNIATATDFPDVPTDQRCTTSSCTTTSPTYFSQKRLSSVSTQVWNGTAYVTVDKWDLDQSFPDPGDGNSAALWLKGITHTGTIGSSSVTLPAVTFGGQTFVNRVAGNSDGVAPLTKFRMQTIDNETGGELAITFAPTNCTTSNLPTAEANTLRCFPIQWKPPGNPERTDWFHKYVVSQVSQVDRVGGNTTQVTNYRYNGDGAWAWDDNPLTVDSRRTWNQWRGYGSVTVLQGDSANDSPTVVTASKYTYFRGMDGDHLSSGTRSASVVDSQGVSVADSKQLAGNTRETVTTNGDGGAVMSSVITDYLSKKTASNAGQDAYLVRTAKTTSRAPLSTGGIRTATSSTTYDDDGLAVTASDSPDASKPEDDRCTTTKYAKNRDKWILGTVSEVESVAKTCGATVNYPADAIARAQTAFDGQDFGVAPTKGDMTQSQQVTSYSGSTPVWTTQTKAAYDSYGRVTSATDVLGTTSTTAYSPATGFATKVTVTNAKSWTTSTTVGIERGQTTAATDQNNRTTTVTYDGLGRTTAVRGNGMTQDNVQYIYNVNKDSPTIISSRTVNALGGYTQGYTYYDGFLRARQTQSPSNGGKRVLTDQYYNSAGQLSRSNNAYVAEGAPGSGLLVVQQNAAVSHMVTLFDGAGRITNSILMDQANEKWRSTTQYNGSDSVAVTPPNGGTATTTISDDRGQKVKLLQYKASTPTGDADTTLYSYSKSGKLEQVTDTAGNKWSYTYDLSGNQLTAADPDKGTSSTTYDAAGKVLTTTDARGKVLAYAYDVLGRKTGQYEGSTSGTRLAAWVYDLTLKGYISTSTSYVNGVSYKNAISTYDYASRPTTSLWSSSAKTGNVGDEGYTTTTSYNLDGSPSTVTLPTVEWMGSEKLTYGYDDLARPKSLTGVITDAGTGVASKPITYVNTLSYDSLGRAAQIKAGGKDSTGTDDNSWLTNTLTYDDPSQRMIASTIQRGRFGVGLGDVIQDLKYSYNDAGGVTSIDDQATTGGQDKQCFAYDYLQRLTAAWSPNSSTACQGGASTSTLGGPAPYWQSFTYDAIGNRTSKTEHATATGSSDVTWNSTYGSALPHALTSVTNGSQTDSFAYDATGNTNSRTVNSTTTTQTWDARGNMTVNGAQTNVYGADGELVVRQDATAGSDTLFAAGHQITATKQNGGIKYDVERTYSLGGFQVAVRTDKDSTGLYWLAADKNGTASVAVKASDLSLTKRYTDPFGTARGTSTAFPTSQGFVGGYQDKQTGLSRLGARDYDPALGRFISVDPILSTDNGSADMNAYSYAGNSPITFSDPTGLATACTDDGTCQRDTPFGFVQTAPGKPPVYTTPSGQTIDKSRLHDAYQWAAQQKQKARAAAGVSQDDEAKAVKILQQSKWQVALEAAGSILKEILGIGDMERCFGSGDVGSCVSMVVGLIPWTKVFSVGGKIVEGLTRAWKALSSFVKEVQWANRIVSKIADSKAAIAIEDAGESLSCPIMRNSFVAGTKVVMADGTLKPIEAVKVGDQVRNAKPGDTSGATETHAVTQLHVTDADKDYVDLTVTTKAGASQVVRVTGHHLFYSGSRHSWEYAGELEAGERLQTSDGQVATVSSLRIFRSVLRTFNLTVDIVHTYLVAAAGAAVLVHNCGGLPDADTVRMLHYTNSKGANGIVESGIIKASDQNKVFMLPAKGKLMSPRDAESTLGIGRGRGNKVLEFDAPADRVSSRYNKTMGITEWVADGDLEISNITVSR